MEVTRVGDITSPAGITQSAAPSSGSGHTIRDEGTPLTARANLNFIGAGVTVTDNAGTNSSDVTIPGGGGTPGGSNTQMQYNNSGAFGGTSGLTWNGLDLSFAGAQALLFRSPGLGVSSPSAGILQFVATTEARIYGDTIQLNDQAGNRILELVDVASDNYLQIKNAVAGSPVLLNAVGTDSNIHVNVVPKGTGHLQENGVNVLLANSSFVTMAKWGTD